MKIYLTVSFLFIAATTVFSEKIDRSYFENGVSLYAKKDYKNALKIFLDIKDKGYDNYQLNYDIASCYYKMEKYGFSRFYFERALYFKPFDKDLMQNLKLVYSKIMSDPVLGEQEIMNKRIIFFLPLKILLSLLLLFTLLIIFLIFQLFRNTGNKMVFQVLTILTGAFIILLTILFFIQYGDYKKKTYVVTANSSDIYLLPDDNETVLNTVTEGEKGDIIMTNNDYIKIKISDGTEGWIKKNNIIINMN